MTRHELVFPEDQILIVAAALWLRNAVDCASKVDFSFGVIEESYFALSVDED